MALGAFESCSSMIFLFAFAFVFVSVFVVVGIGVLRLSFRSCLSFVHDNCDNLFAVFTPERKRRRK